MRDRISRIRRMRNNNLVEDGRMYAHAEHCRVELQLARSFSLLVVDGDVQHTQYIAYA